jgi:hypothetical protein
MQGYLIIKCTRLLLPRPSWLNTESFFTSPSVIMSFKNKHFL